ncbi:MAG: alpha/beta fold hydrolase [Betaproteobacteria bacterium]
MADDRPALLLLPGLLCDRASWAPVLPALGRHAKCAVADYSSESTLEAMAVHVLAYAPPRFALAGHSMGGRVALEVLRRAPGRVTRIALLDTGYRSRADGSAGDDERTRRLALLALARDQGMRAMGREWMQAMVHPQRLRDAPLVEAILAMIERQTPDRYAAQIAALLARPDVADLLRSVRVPALVACGRDDAWSALPQHEEIAALVPGSRLAVFDRCGHMAPMEQPDAVASALIAWLAMDATGASGADDRRLPSRHATG